MPEKEIDKKILHLCLLLNMEEHIMLNF